MRRTLIYTFALLLVAACEDASRGRTEPPKLVILGEDSSNLRAYEAYTAELGFHAAKVTYRPVDYVESIRIAQIEMDAVRKELSNRKSGGSADSQGGARYDILMQYSNALHFMDGCVYTVDELRSLAESSRRGDLVKKLDLAVHGVFPEVWKETCFFIARESLQVKNAEPVALGLPFAANTMVLVVNDSLVNGDVKHVGATKPAPTTWPRLIESSRELAGRGGDVGAICLQGAKDGWLYQEWCNFVYSSGGAVSRKKYGWEAIADDASALLSEETIKATENYLSLRPYNVGGFFAVDPNEQRRSLLTGKVAFAIVWSDYLHFLEQESVRAKSRIKFSYHPIPSAENSSGKSMIAGGAFFISKGSREPLIALEYVLELLDVSAQRELMNRGLCSPIKAAYDGPLVEGVPYAASVRESLERGIHMLEASRDSSIVESAITNALQSAWRKNGDWGSLARQALEQAHREIMEQRALRAGK